MIEMAGLLSVREVSYPESKADITRVFGIPGRSRGGGGCVRDRDAGSQGARQAGGRQAVRADRKRGGLIFQVVLAS